MSNNDNLAPTIILTFLFTTAFWLLIVGIVATASTFPCVSPDCPYPVSYKANYCKHCGYQYRVTGGSTITLKEAEDGQ